MLEENERIFDVVCVEGSFHVTIIFKDTVHIIAPKSFVYPLYNPNITLYELSGYCPRNFCDLLGVKVTEVPWNSSLIASKNVL